jgi:hypothetical protein
LAANLQLAGLFSDEKLLSQTDHQHVEQLLLLLRLEGKCSLLSLSSILKALHYHPDSLGYLSQFFHSAGQALPSTLLMPSKKLVFYLSDAIFAIHAPIVVTIDARSTAILNIELASDRSAETWRTHFEALEHQHFFSLGMASDRGKGVVAGYQAACDMALWVADYFHEFRDLFEVRNQWERKAYAAINKEYEAARRFANARSESNLQQRLQQYDTAHRACEQAITLYDQLDVLLDLLRDALHICSPHGKLRTPEGVRAELTRLFDMIAELDGAAITQTLKPMRHHIDDILLPFKHAEAIAAERRVGVPHEALDCLVLAWHQEHLRSPSGSKHKRSHQRERDGWLACADALLDEAFDTLKTLVFDKLDAIIRASSLVEMVNALLRPYLKSCTGHLTQETVNLLMFYHHHRRYKSGKRQGKAPIALWTGKPWEAPWWELFRQQINTKRGVTAPGTGLARPPLQLVVNNERCTDRQAIASGQTLVDPIDAPENDCRHKDSEAASSFHLCSKPHCELGSKGWIGPTSSHDRHVTRQTVNYFRPVLKGAESIQKVLQMAVA